MFKLIFTESYSKKEKAFLSRRAELTEKYKNILKLLELNPGHTSLKLHKLQGKFKNKYAVSLTYSYRIILSFTVVKDEILLIDIGSHGEVY
ncbi:MAG: plasmid stabilization protein [Deltaproteobacteria bacterium]|nr:plasmid stabilization protein [Deltaproteobacteria bacterium]